MRWLLVIPAWILFLSNIPFVREIKMDDMPVMATSSSGKGCCAKNKGQKMTCKKSVMLSIAQPDNQKSCSRATDTSCICISCFQFIASAPVWQPFKMHSPRVAMNYTGFLLSKWKNLPVSPPWRPPDIG
jgi:hypothetical protein